MNGFTRRSLALAILLGALSLPGPGSWAADAKLITLDAEDAYLPSVLKILAEKGDLNIITGPGVTGGRLSIHMKNVPVDQAVNLVVRAAGLAYERIGNSVLVADASALKTETGLSSYVVDLKYADAVDVQAALKDLSAEIQVDRVGNRLIVVTSPRVIAEIQSAVDDANKAVSKAEAIRKFTILPVDWTEEGGQLTPSLKLKRAVVMKEFGGEVEALYSGGPQ